MRVQKVAGPWGSLSCQVEKDVRNLGEGKEEEQGWEVAAVRAPEESPKHREAGMG